LVDGQKVVDKLADLELGLRPIKTFDVDADFFRKFS
jgi:hypothetical protein